MTMQPPPPPAPPSPEALARTRAENEALQAQVQNQALRQAAAALQGGESNGARAGNVSVIKDATGKVVVTTADGRTVTIDPAAGLNEDAVQELVQTALEPPRLPGAPPDHSEQAARILGIVLPFALAIIIVAIIGQVLLRRASAARAVAQTVPPDLAARLARIEQAVEAVAIEVERISESERYSARILTERLPDPLANGRVAVTAEAQRSG